MADVACVECGQRADPHSPPGYYATSGRRCWRCWLTDPADIKPALIYVECRAGRRLVAYLAGVVGGCAR